MQEQHLFEYAIVRLMPRIERGELLNVGVIVFCPRKKFLQALITLDEKKLMTLSPTSDIEELRTHLSAFLRVSAGGPGSGPIGQLDAASRFRWLTATRSTTVQSSSVHIGFTHDLQEELIKLHGQLVL